MVKKSVQEAKANKKAKDSANRCIYCRKPCSMSGMCMMPWPEFANARPRRAKNDDEDQQEHR